jgi:hypothetical protein
MSASIKTFMKKPEFVEAQQFLDDADSYLLLYWINARLFADSKFNSKRYAEWINEVLLIPTLDGYYIAKLGDWVVRDTHGNFFVYTADTFNELFEEA